MQIGCFIFFQIHSIVFYNYFFANGICNVNRLAMFVCSVVLLLWINSVFLEKLTVVKLSVDVKYLFKTWLFSRHIFVKTIWDFLIRKYICIIYIVSYVNIVYNFIYFSKCCFYQSQRICTKTMSVFYLSLFHI